MKRIIIGIILAVALAAAMVPMVSAAAAGPLDHVVLAPTSALVATSGTRQFTAVAQDAANETVPGVTYTWSVAAGGGTIDTAGLFTAGTTTGTFTNTVVVTAVKGEITKTASATVNVAVAGALDEVVLTPEEALIATDGTKQFTAVAKDAFDTNITGVTYNWAVAAGGGTIDTAGLFTAGDTAGAFPNTIAVTAVKGDTTKTATANVTIAVPGQIDEVVISPASAVLLPAGTKQFSVVSKDAFDANVDGVAYTWSVAAGGGTIDAAGLFTAGAMAGAFPNTVVVTAVKGSVTKTASADITVAVAGVLDHVVVTPASATVAPSGTKQFSAVGKDAFDANVEGVTYTWSVAAGGGTIDTAGLFTAGDVAGTFTNTVVITAVKGEISKTASATVIVAINTGDDDDEDEDEDDDEDDDEDSDRPHGWDKGEKKGWGGEDTPPGWSKGNKTGWNGGNMPPGLAKKVHSDDEDDD